MEIETDKRSKLVLTLEKDEFIEVNGKANIYIANSENSKKTVRLMFEAPKEVKIVRRKNPRSIK